MGEKGQELLPTTSPYFPGHTGFNISRLEIHALEPCIWAPNCTSVSVTLCYLLAVNQGCSVVKI